MSRPKPAAGKAGATYRGISLLFGTVAILLGVAVIAVTAARGGGPLAFGFAFGGILIALGAARIYLARSR